MSCFLGLVKIHKAIFHMEMKNKNITLSIIILVLIIIATIFIYWLFTADNIRSKVLSSLKENLEFCQILKDKISFKKGEFWMMCNGRPFYAAYENGKVITELNGWSFLKDDSNLWNELENCDYYDSKNSEIIFYCHKDFNSENLIAKIYRFNQNSLKMEKIGEENFLDVISSDIASIYGFLSECDIKDFSSSELKDYPDILSLIFNCQDDNYIVVTDLATIPLQPPILINSDLSYEERAKLSFEKSFGLPVENIKERLDQVIITSHNFEITYTFFEPIPTINYILKEVYNEEDVQISIKELGKYFIFPPLKTLGKIEPLEEVYQNVFAYKINDENIIAISWIKPINLINAFWKKTEGIYR